MGSLRVTFFLRLNCLFGMKIVVNNSYIVLCFVKIYELRVLYIYELQQRLENRDKADGERKKGQATVL